jgi:hypothetical protein
VSLVIKLLNDQIKEFYHFDELAVLISQMVKSILATGAMLRSFSRLASPTRSLSIGLLQWLDGARTPPLPTLAPVVLLQKGKYYQNTDFFLQFLVKCLRVKGVNFSCISVKISFS